MESNHHQPTNTFSNAENSELKFLRSQVFTLSERLKEAEKYKSSFLSNMRNEIINPFSSILSLSNLLLRDEQPSRLQVHKLLSHIYHETFALNFHLKTIFLAAEIECGECYPAPARIRPEAIVAETLAALDHLMRKKNIQLAIYQSFEEDVWGDPEKLQMIFLELLYAILTKSKPDDRLSVKTYTKDGILYAEMYNISMMGNKKKSLFEYARFEELYMFKESIEGIHLSVAKSLTDILNGRLEAGSYQGEIAAFRFNIPVGENLENGDLFEEQGLIFK